MANILTVEQILALAPDASAAKTGQGLANKQKWVTLGRTEEAAWGECAGSASTPYQTQIDLNGPAFKCSCPSRKFPCKHGLGLYLLLANQAALFSSADPPPWVASWLESRAKREAKATAATTEEAPAKAPDPKEQARRAAKRLEKVTRGLEDLELWLCDLVRQGLGAVQSQPRSCWETMAARMVDAQASGLARLLREMAEIPASGEGWQERLLERISRLYLIIDRYKRLDKLPDPAQADIRSLIGWTQNQDELLAQEGVADTWAVLGQRISREDRLRVQRTWLWGTNSGRAALLLQFAAGKETFQSLLAPGMQLAAALVFFPGAYPLRALVKQQNPVDVKIPSFTGYGAIADAYKAYAGALAKYPWLEQFPMPMDAVIPQRREDGWLVRDAAGHLFPLASQFAYPWELLAFSGGHPVSLFGEWDGDTLLPLSMASPENFVAFTTVEE